MNEEITIRKAQPKNINSMASLLEELFAMEKDFTFDLSRHIRGLQLLLESSNKSCAWVALSDSKVVGMCSVQTVISTAAGGVSGWVEDVVVTESYRRMGIATQLLRAVDKWAMENNIHRIQLLADIANTSAMEFYIKCRWTETQLVCMRKFL